MTIDQARKLADATKLHEEVLRSYPMQEAVMQLCLQVAQRDQQIEHWQNVARGQKQEG